MGGCDASLVPDTERRRPASRPSRPAWTPQPRALVVRPLARRRDELRAVRIRARAAPLPVASNGGWCYSCRFAVEAISVEEVVVMIGDIEAAGSVGIGRDERRRG